jgi:hypothetical protein
VAERASSEASEVASTAVEGAREVAGEVSAQAKAVATQARQQLDGLFAQSRDELRQQAERRGSQAASQLKTLSQQVTALADGRPQEAGPLVNYLDDAQSQIQRLASRLEEGGPQGVLDDVTSFARRRPGLFLAGAVGAGFLIGRVARAAAANQQDGGQSNGDPSRGLPADRTLSPGLSQSAIAESTPVVSAQPGTGMLA